MIRVGIVGYGTIGRLHAQAWQEVPGSKLAVVADCDAASLEKAQNDWNLPAVASVDEMLEKYDVDLIDICVPTPLHESVMRRAIEGDKHVFCEKPLARSLEEGQRMVELSSGYHKKVGIGHVVRFTPAYQKMRQSIKDGEVGEPGVIRTFRGGSQFPMGYQNWFADFDQSGGVILDLLIHDLDYCRWLFGDVERVYAQSTRGRAEEQLEHAMIVLRFKNGVIGHVEGSWTNFPGQFYTRVEMAGTNGLISFDSRSTEPIRTMNAAGVRLQVGPTAVNPYALELLDMVEAIKEDREPLITPHDAYETLNVALAALESVRTGQVVKL